MATSEEREREEMVRKAWTDCHLNILCPCGKISYCIQKLSPVSPVIITGEIHGLEKGEHGMHVHEFGDLTHGCESAGEHYNPFHKNHGGQFDDDRHLGDLGNIVAGAHGVAKVYKVDQVMSLFGEHSVLGRTMVVHANPDDLGQGGDEESKKSGNSGDRVACGIIHLIKH
ncbi:superoxide dismutase [Cu-Zn]-like isoform X2 [Centruroides sculpturatus]|uniref:superoxide dismutase [Cu-Zn]-like isoform X2 n=1 Tax=Centruroides sculpturatus TaxID=218467 RepID=UPI000C6CA6AF|nr:superoxide dismutase [Cu-Zn]-like isoform X2 [Centruroides sculpturatus]XP_023234314.1 superoxide dismutase [Cu-Zn]-like isoform X2 [Centruroides sculpturatus]